MTKYKNFFKISTSLLAAHLVGVACTSKAQQTNKDESRPAAFTEVTKNQELNQSAARKVDAHNFVEIKFPTGSAELNSSTKANLDEVIETANRSGEVNEVVVMSWADQEYPSKKLNKLSKQQRDLANQRSNNISKYIKSARNVDVDTYNMTEQPNVFAKWFNTTDYKLKNTLMAAGLPTTADNIKYPSKAQHSIVLVKIK